VDGPVLKVELRILDKEPILAGEDLRTVEASWVVNDSVLFAEDLNPRLGGLVVHLLLGNDELHRVYREGLLLSSATFRRLVHWLHVADLVG